MACRAFNHEGSEQLVGGERNAMQVSDDSNNATRRERATSSADAASDTFGSWTYTVGDGVLSWTDSVFVLFGFGVNDVVPTLSLMSSHQHPLDQVIWDEQLRRIMTAGATVSVWHRIIDAGGKHRTVHTILSAVVDNAGAVVQVSGLMTDVTARLDQDRSQAAAEAVTRSALTRGVIEQAKGIIMATMDVEEQAAFDLLRWHSSHMNVKVRDVATAVVGQRTELTVPAASTPRERLTAAIAGVAAVRKPLPAVARSSSDPAIDIDARQETARTSRIPPTSLPATMLRAVAGAAQSISISDYNAPDQPLVYVNRAFERLTGYRAEAILGRNCRFLQGPAAASESEAVAVALMRRAISEGREIRTVVRNYRRDGSAFWNELHLSAVRNETGRISHYIGYQQDVTERVVREQQLELLAFHDARTNLPNQAAAVQYLNRMFDQGAEASSNTVLRVHLTGFRAADGADGPPAIGAVLATAGQRLRAALDPPTYLAKLDDDSFLVVLSNAGSPDFPAHVLADPITVENASIQFQVRVEELGSEPLGHLRGLL